MTEVAPVFLQDPAQSLAVLLVALVADGALAGLPAIRHAFALPVALLGGVTGWFDRRLNRERRSAANRLIRGAFVLAVVAGLAGLAGWLIAVAVGGVQDGWIIEAAFVATLILQRRPFDGARAVWRALGKRSVERGRAALGAVVFYDTSSLDEHAVARGAIESCAVKFCDGVVAPAFWYLLLGLPGLCVYRAVNVMAERIGHPSPRHAAFGSAAARIDRALNFVPAPLSGAILAVAALFVPAANPLRSLRAMMRHSRNHASPSAGWTESAVAGALGLALAGPRRYAGAAIGGPWIGDGRARATANDIGRAIYLFAVANIMTVGLVAVLALARAPA